MSKQKKISGELLQAVVIMISHNEFGKQEILSIVDQVSRLTDIDQEVYKAIKDKLEYRNRKEATADVLIQICDREHIEIFQILLPIFLKSFESKKERVAMLDEVAQYIAKNRIGGLKTIPFLTALIKYGSQVNIYSQYRQPSKAMLKIIQENGVMPSLHQLRNIIISWPERRRYIIAQLWNRPQYRRKSIKIAIERFFSNRDILAFLPLIKGKSMVKLCTTKEIISLVQEQILKTIDKLNDHYQDKVKHEHDVKPFHIVFDSEIIYMKDAIDQLAHTLFRNQNEIQRFKDQTKAPLIARLLAFELMET